MNGKRSNYDQLFITGRRCFYVDPCKDHRVDHVYSWESIFSGFPGSVYVWCRDQLLYSYQKLLILLCCIFCLSFPAFAEDEKYEFQSIQNEALYLQGYNLNQYYNSVAHDDLLKNNPNDPSINTYSDQYIFNLLKYEAMYTGRNSFVGRFIYSGRKPDIIKVYRKYNNSDFQWITTNQDYIFDNYFLAPPQTDGRVSTYYINGLKVTYDDHEYDVDTGEISFHYTDLNDSWTTIIDYIGGKMTEYLAQVAQVFTWILTHITELITFILGNPFLAVSLVLFMCGAVISFYIRIKNS